MLIDTYLLRNASLQEYPNQLVVAVKVRTWEKTGDFPWGTSEIHGEEGVWHQLEGASQKEIVRLKPMTQVEEEPYRLLFDLCPVIPDDAHEHQLLRQRWLVRYWDDDVYLPTIRGIQVMASSEILDDGTVFWSVTWDCHSLSGITLPLE